VRQPDESLTFLGFTLRHDRDRFGRGRRYLNVFPSVKAQARARETLRELTGPQRNFVPIAEMVNDVNRWLGGWGNYFRHGYPSAVFNKLNWYVVQRLTRRLKRRSDRPYRIPAGESSYAHLQRLGLRLLRTTSG
jgi:RNA-directed DNA polymerase